MPDQSKFAMFGRKKRGMVWSRKYETSKEERGLYLTKNGTIFNKNRRKSDWNVFNKYIIRTFEYLH